MLPRCKESATTTHLNYIDDVAIYTFDILSYYRRETSWTRVYFWCLSLAGCLAKSVELFLV